MIAEYIWDNSPAGWMTPLIGATDLGGIAHRSDVGGHERIPVGRALFSNRPDPLLREFGSGREPSTRLLENLSRLLRPGNAPFCNLIEGDIWDAVPWHSGEVRSIRVDFEFTFLHAHTSQLN